MEVRECGVSLCIQTRKGWLDLYAYENTITQQILATLIPCMSSGKVSYAAHVMECHQPRLPFLRT
jgi:hypothetical protein